MSTATNTDYLIAVSIPIHDPSGSDAPGTQEPEISPIRLFKVPKGENPRTTLKRKVERHGWRVLEQAGDPIGNCIPFFALHHRYEVTGELDESVLTGEQSQELRRRMVIAKGVLQRHAEIQQEWEPKPI